MTYLMPKFDEFIKVQLKFEIYFQCSVVYDNLSFVRDILTYNMGYNQRIFNPTDRSVAIVKYQYTLAQIKTRTHIRQHTHRYLSSHTLA